MLIALFLLLGYFLLGVGGTYSYLAFQEEDTVAIKGNIVAIDADLDVELVVGTNEKMVPMLDAALSNAINGVGSDNGPCIDSVGNLSCQVYKITLTNNGSRLKNLIGTIELYPKEVTGNAYTNLKWRELTNPKTIKDDSIINGMSKSTLVSDLTIESKEVRIWYIAVWISEVDYDQREIDKGLFGGTVTFEAESGSSSDSTAEIVSIEASVADGYETVDTGSAITKDMFVVIAHYNDNSSATLASENFIINPATAPSTVGNFEVTLSLNSNNFDYDIIKITDTVSMEAVKPTGLFDADGNQLASWDELVNTYGMDVEIDHSSHTEAGTMYYVLKNNTELSSGVNLVMPDTVTYIGTEAFSVCTELTSVTIPDSVTSIGVGAFSGAGLTSVTIPDSVTYIGDEAFSVCTELTSVTIPDSVISIGVGAFNSTGLTSVTIPDSVTSIENSAFAFCDKLISVYFEHTTAPTFGLRCFYKNSGSNTTFYFKNSTVANAFTGGGLYSGYYNTMYGTKSTNYSW